MDSRERIRLSLDHRKPDRVAIHDSPWGATAERWKGEGLPEYSSPAEYFGYELVTIGCDTSPRFPVKTIEKTDRYIIQTTASGAVNKNFHDYASTPELIDRPIKQRRDWDRMKDRFAPDFTRVDWASAKSAYQTAREEGKFICFSGGYGYDILQGYMRSDQLLMAMADDPAWVREMSVTIANLTMEMAKMMMENGLEFDAFFTFNDMGYRNGLLFSPDTYRKTQKEADQMVYSFFHERNMPIILHSCGNVKEVIPDLIEIGLDCLQPLEVKAGMDLRELKKTYGGKLSFMGGIDVRAMADPGPSAIEDEIASKIEVAKEGGGYIYHSDHSVPNNVSFEQYCRVIELVKKYGGY